MSAYWVQFVKTGNPNMAGLPVWRSFSDQEPQSMIFGDTSSARLLPDKAALDFLYKGYPGK
jgi:para-nitrobenzyl esterase